MHVANRMRADYGSATRRLHIGYTQFTDRLHEDYKSLHRCPLQTYHKSILAMWDVAFGWQVNLMCPRSTEPLSAGVTFLCRVSYLYFL